jgi:hypothetical protein
VLKQSCSFKLQKDKIHLEDQAFRPIISIHKYWNTEEVTTECSEHKLYHGQSSLESPDEIIRLVFQG